MENQVSSFARFGTGNAAAGKEQNWSGHATHDPYHHTQALQQWQLRYDQLSRGVFEGQIVEAWINGIQIFEEWLSQSVCQTGCVSSDTVALGVFEQLSGEARWEGASLGMSHIVSLTRRRSLELTVPRNSVLLSVSVPTELLSGIGDVEPGRDHASAQFLRGLDSSVVVSAELANIMRSRLRSALFAMIHQPRQMASLAVRNQLTSEIVGLVDHYVSAALSSAAVPSPSKARRVVRVAREYIERNVDTPISVLELCKQTYTSRRTLQYCFETVIGMSPAAYLKAMRLNGVRRDLIISHGKVTVSDTAAKWGFWHFSQFATDYRNFFGELPSETLRLLA